MIWKSNTLSRQLTRDELNDLGPYNLEGAINDSLYNSEIMCRIQQTKEVWRLKLFIGRVVEVKISSYFL